MAKKSEKNENRRESLRKVKECLKKKAKEAPKQKAKEAKKANVELTDAQKLALIEETRKRDYELIPKIERARKDRIVDTFLNIGYVFSPEEGKLLDYHLRNKIMDEPMDYCPIKEVNVYANHPQALTGKSKVWYFFTRSRPNEIQPGIDVQGHWIFGEKNDIFYQDKKVGVKQVVEYCEAGHKSEYKIIEYQLDPAPDYMKTGLWFVCKLYNDGSCVDVHSGP
uniref:NAC domain-containing protein n=1 Tax=Davidia involucrata TaxID=16924 RepID=A0A5B7AY69_DAVIN